MRLETYKMATSILLKFQTLKCDISRTIWRIEVSDGSLFCIFHTLSFERNLFFDRTCHLMHSTAIVLSTVNLRYGVRVGFHYCVDDMKRYSIKGVDDKLTHCLHTALLIVHQFASLSIIENFSLF